MKARIASYGKSDVGLQRTSNEDLWTALPELQFYALADGMGGHKAGEVAAYLAIICLTSAIHAFPSALSPEEAKERLRTAFIHVNRTVYSASCQEENLRGMGTTLCCLFFQPRSVVWANVGDSRIYRMRSGRLTQLSQDHSLRAEMLASGRLAAEESTHFPPKNIITRSIGNTAQVVPDVDVIETLPNDLFFLCSDGLTDSVINAEITSIIASSASIQSATDRLIEKAKERGGNDNITIVMIKLPP